ncbi:MAG: transposase [Nitrospinae bacterium]|nr:transposase [Nitrospinota bacterium]
MCSGSQRLSAFAGDIDGNRPGASSGPPDAGWERENAEWRERDWHGEEFVYLWADGIYLKVRGVERRCLLLVVGCDTCGRKRFLALEAGSGIMWNSS